MMKILNIILFLPYTLIMWFIWWFFAIIVISLMILISLIIPKEKYNYLVRLCCVFLTYSAFIFPRVKGEKIKDVPFPVIFVGNHVSFFDLFISATTLPGYPRGLELAKHFTMPFYGWFISRFGQIPIELKHPGKIKHSFEVSINILKNGVRNIFVMPEGTRTSDGKIARFRLGAFYLSKKSGYPIVPVVFKGLYKISRKGSILLRPGIVDVVILKPVYPDNFNSEEEMANYTRELMIKELDNKDGKYE